jgi:hypothetical protein
MVSFCEAPVVVAVSAGLTSPVWAAAPLAAGSGRGACGAPRLAPTQPVGEGTPMPRISIKPGHVQESVFGGTSTHKPYNYTTRAALGGGELGSYPAREPEPV